jgi:hypothetical protein
MHIASRSKNIMSPAGDVGRKIGRWPKQLQVIQVLPGASALHTGLAIARCSIGAAIVLAYNAVPAMLPANAEGSIPKSQQCKALSSATAKHASHATDLLIGHSSIVQMPGGVETELPAG